MSVVGNQMIKMQSVKQLIDVNNPPNEFDRIVDEILNPQIIKEIQLSCISQ